MTRRTLPAAAIAALVLGIVVSGTQAHAQRPSLAGRWTLNRSLSQFPSDVGFGMDLVAGARTTDTDTGGGRLGGSGSAFPNASSIRESPDDSKRREQLVEEVRTPSPHLIITQTETSVTLTDDRGTSRTFHPDGRQESQMIGQVPVSTISKWDGARLEVRYFVEQNREMRYLYSRTPVPSQLVVQVQLVERGGHDTVTRIYEPTRADEPVAPSAAPPTSAVPPGGGAPPAQGALPPGTSAPPTGLPGSGLLRPAVPSLGGDQAPLGAVQGPDAEFKGLTQLGVVVEDLSPQAAACGLKQASVDAAVSKSLTDAGLKVLHNTDEDTYVYVQILTTSASAGFCVSRYDVTLYSYTTARLSYQAASALLQVSLFHKGGLTGGAPASHGDAVVKGVKQYADEIATRIRDVNRK